MAATVRGTPPAATTAQVSNGTSLAVAKPAGTTTGDLLLAVVWQDSDGYASQTSLQAPTGWTQAGATIATSGTSPWGKVFWKVAGASEPTSYTFALASGSSTVIHLLAITGADPDTPIRINPAAAAGTGTTITAPTIASGSGQAAGDLLFCSFSSQGGSTTYSGYSTGLVEQADVTSTWVSGASATEAVTGTGALGPNSTTASLSPNGNWRALSLVVSTVNSVSASPTAGVAGVSGAAQGPAPSVSEAPTADTAAADPAAQDPAPSVSVARTPAVALGAVAAQDGIGAASVANPAAGLAAVTLPAGDATVSTLTLTQVFPPAVALWPEAVAPPVTVQPAAPAAALASAALTPSVTKMAVAPAGVSASAGPPGATIQTGADPAESVVTGVDAEATVAVVGPAETAAAGVAALVPGFSVGARPLVALLVPTSPDAHTDALATGTVFAGPARLTPTARPATTQASYFSTAAPALTLVKGLGALVPRGNLSLVALDATLTVQGVIDMADPSVTDVDAALVVVVVDGAAVTDELGMTAPVIPTLDAAADTRGT